MAKDQIGTGAFALAAVPDGSTPKVWRLLPAGPSLRPSGMANERAGGRQKGGYDIIHGACRSLGRVFDPPRPSITKDLKRKTGRTVLAYLEDREIRQRVGGVRLSSD